MHPRLQQLVREYPGLRTLASFSRQYNVWIVEFLREDTELGFASIGTDGEVLEVEIKPHLGAKQRKP